MQEGKNPPLCPRTAHATCAVCLVQYWKELIFLIKPFYEKWRILAFKLKHKTILPLLNSQTIKNLTQRQKVGKLEKISFH